jgi:hypothetical protein
MITINIDIKEVFLLTIFFTALAVYLSIHSQKHISMFITNHITALFLSLVISKFIYNILKI